MKKIALILCLIITISLCAGCSDKKVEDNLTSPTQSTQTLTVTKTDEASVTPTPENWGIDESIVGEVDYDGITAHIKFPAYAGIVEGPGKVAKQADNTLVILGGEKTGKSPDLPSNKAEDILPAYFERASKIVEDYRGSFLYTDFEFTVKSKETVTVNDYEMVKCIGVHSHKYNGKLTQMNYVAYATRLKGNNAVVYWAVFDESADQSLSKLIESHADNMAKSLHE